MGHFFRRLEKECILLRLSRVPASGWLHPNDEHLPLGPGLLRQFGSAGAGMCHFLNRYGPPG